MTWIHEWVGINKHLESYFLHSSCFHNAGTPGIPTRDLCTCRTGHQHVHFNWIPLHTTVIWSTLLHQINLAVPGSPILKLLSSLRSMQTVKWKSPRSSGEVCCLSTVYQRCSPPPFQLALINGTEKIFHKGVKSHRLVLFRRGKTVACWPLEEIWQYYFPFISEDTQGLKREHLFPI